MTMTLSDPVNLISELDEDSSQSYVRRVVARILGHAEITMSEARELWVSLGFNPDLWDRYTDTIAAMR